jgi:hypothetical protein
MLLVTLVILLVVPVVAIMLAAKIVGARRTGFWISLLAMIVSAMILAAAVKILHVLGLLAFFVAPLGYMVILDTTYLRALVLVFLQYVISTIIVVVLAVVMFGGVMLGIDRLLHETPLRLDAPAQSV